MSETLSLRKRLIGKEDINFDISGTGETEDFFSSDGRKVLTKLNASHVPLTTGTRDKVNATNVDSAILILSDKVDNFSSIDVLEDDVTVTFLPEDSIDEIQDKIDIQKRNLNGHTLTFEFPVSLQQNLYSSLIFRDFANGTVKITGGDSGSKAAIYDMADIGCLFRIYRCQCEVEISYFYFVHQYSVYGVSAESSSSVIIRGCNFSGLLNTDSYALNKSVSNGILIDCQLSDDIEYYPPPVESESFGKSIGEIFLYPGTHIPEGSYLLNGQTIKFCDELYPDFWGWLFDSGVRVLSEEDYELEVSTSGICSGFVINSSTGSVRLPDFRNGTVWGGDFSNNGEILLPGLPNITGSFDGGENQYRDPTGAFYLGKEVKGSLSDGEDNIIYFDASRSNAIYGNSTTVQPLASRFLFCIQVYNSATALSEQESAQLASEMQTKAQTDLANTGTLSGLFLDKLMPDYNSGVAVTHPTSSASFTAPCAGYFMECFYYSEDTVSSLYINGVKSGITSVTGSSYRNNRQSTVVPLSAGDVVYWDTAATTVFGGTAFFYPVKGV